MMLFVGAHCSVGFYAVGGPRATTAPVAIAMAEDSSTWSRVAQRALNAPGRWRDRLVPAATEAQEAASSTNTNVEPFKEDRSEEAEPTASSPTAPQPRSWRGQLLKTAVETQSELETVLKPRSRDPFEAMKNNRNSDASEADIEALFFALDTDSSGSISRNDLDRYLTGIGLSFSPMFVDALFEECDEDKSGALTLEGFKKITALTGVPPSSKLGAAMELFKQYDADDSGSIDKFEFGMIAQDIFADQRRRTVLACFGAATAAVIVSRYSEEYLWLQKTFRSLYLEPEAEKAQREAFPTALLSDALDEAVARTLAARGYTPANTLFGHSVCSDEVNNKDEQLVSLMVKRWQEGFSLGGLGGLPFAGKSGFRAFLHHVPDKGKLLILFAPHVGIDADGRIGALQRDGQNAVSKACGAGIGAYKALMSKANAPASQNPVLEMEDGDVEFDPELKTIIPLLGSRINGVEDSSDPIAYVTYQMYAIVRELLDQCISETPDVWDWASEVAIVGGVMINRRVGGDAFQPLSFEARRPNGKPTIDLYEQTFGKPPELTSVLGSKAAVKSLYMKRGQTF